MKKKEALLKAIDKIKDANNALGSAWLALYAARDMTIDPAKETNSDFADNRDMVNHLQVMCYNAIDALQAELEELEVSKDGTHNTR